MSKKAAAPDSTSLQTPKLRVKIRSTLISDLVSAAIKDLTGKEPKLSTSGGTSDARFIKDYCPVLEFGLVGQTMHQVDERTTIADLATLTAIYRKVLDRYFG